MEYEFSDIPLSQHSRPLGVSNRFSIKSAYGQLILLVFVPICALAVTGAVIVLSETSRAARAEQQAKAQAILARYEPVVKKLRVIMDSTEGLGQSKQILQSMLVEEHLNRAAVIDSARRSLVHIGSGSALGWPEFKKTRQFFGDIPTSNGTVYGIWAGIGPESPVWLVVEMDNQPLRLAQLKVWLALSVTGLITILLLLLCLNIYSKRWIAPIYEMRLHLQRTDASNLYRPMNVVSSGELNLLQRDVVFLLRSLHVSFVELQEHSEQTEDDLRKAFDEMELQTISIRSARDAAVRASQAKSAFLANISHELRTPLNSIDGFINLLIRKEKLSPEQTIYVQTIKKSSAHLLALVNDVLDFSKIEAGKLVLDEHDVDFYAAVYDVADMLTPVAAEKDLDMAVFYYEDVPTHIVSDELRCKQVLTNLVSNALKFTKQGEVVVRVSLEDAELPNGRKLKAPQIVISVQDTGSGVEKADQKHLFKSFSQGDPSITRQYGGTGLGLVISKQLVRLMGGDIGFLDNAAENLAEQGSTFWFSVPATQVAVAPRAKQPSQHYRVLAWLEHETSFTVLGGMLASMDASLTKASSMADLLNRLNVERQTPSMQPLSVTQEHPQQNQPEFDWVVVDGTSDMSALLSNIREHYRGKIAAFGYQMALDSDTLGRFSAEALYQPINKRTLIGLFEETLGLTEESLPMWHGKTALAVDDHMPNLMVLEALLGELGILARTVTSGFDAIEAVQNSTSDFDIIFMDIQMPRMSGFEAAEKIRALQADSPSKTPIIALTAHALADERDTLLASHMSDYVGKPISHPQLVQVLKKWLDNSSYTPLQMHTVTEPSPKQDSQKLVTHDSAAVTQPVFDWHDALNRSAGKPELARDILRMLLESLSEEKTALQDAWLKSDVQALHQAAHRLAGGTRYTGTVRLRSATQVLQQVSLSLLDELDDTSTGEHTAAQQNKIQDVLHSAYSDVLTALDELAAHDFAGILDA